MAENQHCEDFNEPVPYQEAASYLLEMLSSMSQFAHVSDLSNSAVMLAAAAKVVSQECKLIAAETSEAETVETFRQLALRSIEGAYATQDGSS